MAVNKLGNALAQSGSTFSSDDDPELIKQAVPFSLKLMESLLAENPRHAGLLLAASRGFTQYAYAFVHEDAEEMESEDLAKANQLRERAKKLYLRARNYGLRGLELKNAQFEKQLRSQPDQALNRLTRKDVPCLYWTAVSWAAMISLSKDQPDTIADVPIVEALIDRAYALDSNFDQGALHSFLISFESARKNKAGDLDARVKQHFDRAMELSLNKSAGPLVAFAEAQAVKNQDLKLFQSLLNQALTIKPEAKPEWQLQNLVMQRRACWLLSRSEELFLIIEPQDEKAK